LETSRAAAWEVLQDPVRWPEWWRGVQRVVELHGGDGDRVGSSYRVAWRSRIPYDLEFDFTVESVDPPCCMVGRADGDLAGQGRWRLFEQDGVTAVLYEWDVRTSKPWMNVVGPLARPRFERKHHHVKSSGG
jgi:hypothetical protein